MTALSGFWDLPRDPPPYAPVAFGGELSGEVLLTAYRHGLLAMPTTDPDVAMGFAELYEDEVSRGLIAVLGTASGSPYHLPWWSPDPRPLIMVGGLHLDRRTREFLRSDRGWRATRDVAFDEVVASCAAGRSPQWITDGLAAAFGDLHRRGHAHSVEIWDGDELIGGLFGVRVGPVFSLDSMFFRRSHASKAALVHLQQGLPAYGVRVIDVQWDSPHWARHGAELVDRAAYLNLLRGGVNGAGEAR